MFLARASSFASYLFALFILCSYSVLTLAIEVQQELSTIATPPNDTPSNTHSADDYNQLRAKILSGSATLYEIKQALTENDPYALTNTIHALFAMQQHRGVYQLLHDMWDNPQSLDAKLAKQVIAVAPVRIALASTINRIKIARTDAQISYIRSYKDDPHAFNRAQVVIALGLNGHPADLPYIKLMAGGDHAYVAQSAITSLALMSSNKARDAMIDLWQQYQGSARGQLLKTLLKQSYHWLPPATSDGKAIVENSHADQNIAK